MKFTLLWIFIVMKLTALQSLEAQLTRVSCADYTRLSAPILGQIRLSFDRNPLLPSEFLEPVIHFENNTAAPIPVPGTAYLVDALVVLMEPEYDLEGRIVSYQELANFGSGSLYKNDCTVEIEWLKPGRSRSVRIPALVGGGLTSPRKILPNRVAPWEPGRHRVAVYIKGVRVVGEFEVMEAKLISYAHFPLRVHKLDVSDKVDQSAPLCISFFEYLAEGQRILATESFPQDCRSKISNQGDLDEAISSGKSANGSHSAILRLPVTDPTFQLSKFKVNESMIKKGLEMLGAGQEGEPEKLFTMLQRAVALRDGPLN